VRVAADVEASGDRASSGAGTAQPGDTPMLFSSPLESPLTDRQAPLSRRAAAATSLAELERSLARQDEELQRAFAAFRELADRGRPLPVSADEWSALTDAVETLADTRAIGVSLRPRSSGSRASLPGTRC